MKNNPINKTKHHQGDISWCDCNCHTEGTPQLECKKCYVTHEPTPLTKEQEVKRWFEENYLDGDEIQGGQMISSEECFEAVKEVAFQERNRIVEIVKNQKIQKNES